MNRHFFSILTLLLLALLTSCRESREVNTLLSQADSLMNTRPDSALLILEEAREEVASCPRSQRMRHELLVAKAQNKAYVDFTTDSVMLTVTDYYDHHGTPNERMLAHYLLGCTYRDLGEAPRTLECYKDAVACADTLSPDCDYKVLSSVYSQTADLLHKQLLLSDEIAYRHQAFSCSRHCKDTLHMAHESCRIAGAYCLLNFNDSIEPFMQRGKDLYYAIHKERDWIDYSAILMSLYTKQQASEKLGLLINDFLSEYKEELKTLPQNKKQFFYYIGQYYELEDSFDIAESWYRKIEGSSMSQADKEPLYKGLLSVFKQKHQADSIAKYALLYGEANDSTVAVTGRETTAKFAAMYEFSHMEKESHKLQLAAAKARYFLIFTLLVGLSICTILTLLLIHYKRKKAEKQKEFSLLKEEYLNTKEEYESHLRILEEFKSSQSGHISHLEQTLTDTEKEYQKRSEYLNLKCEKLSQTPYISNALEHGNRFLQTEIVSRIYNIANNPAKGNMTSNDWEVLEETITAFYPSLILDTRYHKNMTKQGFRLLLLMTIHLTSGEMAAILDTVPQRISNIKLNINKALFNDNSARSLQKNLELHYSILFNEEYLNELRKGIKGMKK